MLSDLTKTKEELVAELEALRQRVAGQEGQLQDVQASSRPDSLLGQDPYTLLKTVFSCLHESVFIVDPDTRVIAYANQATEVIFGYSREALIGNDTKRLHVDEVMFEKFGQEMRLHFQAGKYFETEFRLKRNTGEVFPCEILVTPIHDDKGSLITLVSVIRDISKRKRLEYDRRSMEEKYYKAFQSSPDALTISTLDTGIFLEVNPGFELLTGYSREEAVGKSARDLNLWWEPLNREDVIDMLRKEGKKKILDFSIRSKAGKRICGMSAAEVIHLEEGPCILNSFRDITERKKMESSLQDNEKMLQRQAKELEEVNATLTVLLRRADQEKQVRERDATNTLKTLIFPFLDKLAGSGLSSTQESYLDTVTSNLNSLYSPFSTRLARYDKCLTPGEIHVAECLRKGKSSKEVAVLLGLSEKTIGTHRRNIRAKLGILNHKINLRTFLQSLEESSDELSR